MAHANENESSQWLEELGFQPQSRSHGTVWRYAPQNRASRRTKGRKQQSARSLTPPWRIESWEVVERDDALAQVSLRVGLDRDLLRDNLQKLVGKHFGAKTVAEFPVEPRGGTWCLFEFTRPGSREEIKGYKRSDDASRPPVGIGGFRFSFQTDGARTALMFSDYFAVGYVPTSFAKAPTHFVAEALGLEPPTDNGLGSSIYEVAFPVWEPALACARSEQGLSTAGINRLREAFSRDKTALTSNLHPNSKGLLLDLPGDVRRTGYYRDREGPPLEVLESHEREALCRKIDDPLVTGKLDEATREAAERLETEPGDLYLLRRLCLLGIVGRGDHKVFSIGEGLKKEPEHLLFLAYAVRIALEDKDSGRVLSHLSRLGTRLGERLGGMEDLRCFDVVIPEVLGDAWRPEDPRKAEECYLRILQKRGELPRVLRKLIDLTREGGQPEAEESYLERLAAVERRRGELARIRYRQAELTRRKAARRQEAIDLARAALNLDRSHYKAALLAGELLVEQERAEEAIQLLDNLVKDTRLALPAKAKASLETFIAGVWQNNLGRPDLAEKRYECALNHDSECEEALRSLETLYRSRGDRSRLVRLLETRFDLREAARDAGGLREIFDELVDLYRGYLGDSAAAVKLYRRLLGCVTLEPEEIDKILAWRDIRIEWSDLYARLCETLADQPRGARRGQFHCRLSEICRGKLGDHEAAVRHLQDALADGWIDDTSFSYLVERLSADRDYAVLARAYEQRLHQVDKGRKYALLRELLALPDVVSDPKRDSLAVWAYRLRPDDEGVLLDRLSHYRALDDVGGIERFLDILGDQAGLASVQWVTWLERANETLKGMHDEARYGLLDRNYRVLVDQAEDRVAVLQEAISVLRDSSPQEGLALYVRDLLHQDVLPSLDESQVLPMLENRPREQAIFHRLKSYGESNAEWAAYHARTAAVLFGGLDGESENTEKMLARMGSLIPCSDDELANLTHMMSRSRRYGTLARVLQKQVDFENDRRRKFRLLCQLGELYRYRLQDYRRARLTYVLATKYADDPQPVRLELAEIARYADDARRERKCYQEFLSDPSCTSRMPEVKKALGRLRALGERSKSLQKLVLPYAEQALTTGERGLALELTAALTENGIEHTDIYMLAFRAAVDAEDPGRAAEAWWRALACVANRQKARELMQETHGLLERAGRVPLLIDCFDHAMENQVGAQLGPKINKDILVQYGDILFDTDTERGKALSVYQHAHNIDPEDSRVWMPLYFLLSEFGSARERRAHLRQLIPRLEKDPRPLKSYPLTVESMRAELEDLERGGDESGDSDEHEQQPSAVEPDNEDGRAAPGEGESVAATTPMGQVGGEAEGFGAWFPPQQGNEGPSEEPLPPPPHGGGGASPESAQSESPGDLPPPPGGGGGQQESAGEVTAFLDPSSGNDEAGRGVSFEEGGAAGDLEIDFGTARADYQVPAVPFSDIGEGSEEPQPDEPQSEEPQPEEPQVSWHPPSVPEVSTPAEASVDDSASPVEREKPELSAAEAEDSELHHAQDLGGTGADEYGPETSVNLFGLGADAASAHGAEEPAQRGDESASLDLGLSDGDSPSQAEAPRFSLDDDAHDDSDGAGAGSSLELDLSEMQPSAEAPGTGAADVNLDLGDFGSGHPASENEDGPPAVGTPQAPPPPIPGSNPAEPPPIPGAADGSQNEPPPIPGAADGSQNEPPPIPGATDGSQNEPPPIPGQSPEGPPPVPGEQPPPVPGGADAPSEADDGSQVDFDPYLEPSSADAGDGQQGSASLDLEDVSAQTSAPPPPPPPPEGPSGETSHEGDMSRTDLISQSVSSHLSTMTESVGTSAATGTDQTVGGTQSGTSADSYTYGSLAGADETRADGEESHWQRPGEGGGGEEIEGVSDWRAAVLKGDFNANVTDQLMKQAFASEMEKHLAIQAVAVVAGNCDRLQSWHWRVWRHPEEFGYSLTGKERYPTEAMPAILQSSLRRLLISVSPIFVKALQSKFTLEHLGRKLQLNVDEIRRRRRSLEWDEGLLGQVGFGHYAERIGKKRFQAYHIPGLGAEIFYDGRSRAIYFDHDHYESSPPSHVFHRIMSVLWAVRIHYYVPLALDPHRHIMPVLQALHKNFTTQGIERIKGALKPKSRLEKIIDQVDTRQIRSHFEKVGGMPSEHSVTHLVHEMRSHVYRLLLAETLDVVGVFESILDKDLLQENAVKHSEIFEASPHGRALIEFVTKIKV